MFVIEKPKEIHITKWKNMFVASQENSENNSIDFNFFWTATMKEQCFAYSAKNEGEFLGFIVGSVFENFLSKYIFLEILYVNKDYRKMGVGRALLNKLEQQAESMGLDLYIHQVEKTNLVAQRILYDYDKIDRKIYIKKFN